MAHRLRASLGSLLCAVAVVGTAPLPAHAAEPWTLVVNHGRVIDPESGLDAVRHLGIRGDTIALVSETPLAGQREVDARGLVVAPGFIDLHTHSPTPLAQYYQLFDGVTTALELEAGAFPAEHYGSQISQAPLLHFGASVGYIAIRLLHKQGIEMVHLTERPGLRFPRGW